MGDLPEPDGGAATGDDTVSPLKWTPPDSSLPSIGPESFKKAEKSVQKIIFKVLPTAVSEERRHKLIDYLQRLLKTSVGCEVVPYGSVPLKTYLPDGDIDLTILSSILSDGLAKDVISALEAETLNENAEFVVKDVQYICAEVRIVKCIVDDYVVDITFNQIGGLSTLCFFEQVDRLIGKDNLFKRSIILIKAWCYYESRILGGNYGLISTYALETLVLYIFHLFHSSLNDPLAVLYKFLDYYSKFEWEKYCMSIFGPILLSVLQEFVERGDSCDGDDLLLTSEFVGHFVDMFSAPSKGMETKPNPFKIKYLNIMDPLKKDNNLGRCVNLSSYFRIRSAFSFGAKQLTLILMDPERDMEDGLSRFFFNTVSRPANELRLSSNMGFGTMWEVSEIESRNYFGTVEDCGSEQNMMENFGNYAQDLVTSRFDMSNNLPKYQGLTQESCTPPFYPHLYFAESSWSTADKGTPSSPKMQTNNWKKGVVSCESGDGDDGGFSTGINSIGENVVSQTENPHSVALPSSAASISVPTAALNPIQDLSGDYDNHLNYLVYGWSCYQDSLGVPSSYHVNVTPPYPFQLNTSWDAAQQSSQFNQNGFSPVNVNTGIPSPPFYGGNPLVIPGVFYGYEEVPNSRGTGLFLPSQTRPVQQTIRQSPKGRNLGSTRSPRYNSRNTVSVENTGGVDQSSPEVPQPPPVSVDQVAPKPGHPAPAPAAANPSSSSIRGKLKANGSSALVLQDHGGFSLVPSTVSNVPERVKQRHQNSSTCSPRNSAPVSSSNVIHKYRPVKDSQRVPMKSSYHLKDHEDFPPLSL